MFERYTERARQVVVLARDEAQAMRHGYIGSEHLLLGTLREEEGLAARVLAELGVTLDDARTWVGMVVGGGEVVTDSNSQLPFTPCAKKVLERSLREALSMGHNHIGTEHILLSISSSTEGVAIRYLCGDLGLEAPQIRNAVIRHLVGPERDVPEKAHVTAAAPRHLHEEAAAVLEYAIVDSHDAIHAIRNRLVSKEMDVSRLRADRARLETRLAALEETCGERFSPSMQQRVAAREAERA